MTGWRWAAIRVSASLLLAVSGALMVLASGQRWWPACAPGNGKSTGCTNIQDHLYDVWILQSPWVPVGHAAELFGTATLLLAAAFVVLPILLSWGEVPGWAWLSGCVLGLSFFIQGAQTVLSGLAGQAVDTALLMPTFYLQMVLVPLVPLTIFARPRATSEWPKGEAIACVVLFVTLATTHPLVRGMIDIGPYDSRPWSEAIFGVALIIGSLALGPATRPRVPLAATSPASHPSAPAQTQRGKVHT